MMDRSFSIEPPCSLVGPVSQGSFHVERGEVAGSRISREAQLVCRSVSRKVANLDQQVKGAVVAFICSRSWFGFGSRKMVGVYNVRRCACVDASENWSCCGDKSCRFARVQLGQWRNAYANLEMSQVETRTGG